MKQLKGWDAYVAEATSDVEDRSLELPLSDDETYVIPYPTRRQGKQIMEAQLEGDTDKLITALLGEQAGRRVVELSEDQPAGAVDALLVDVLVAFGFMAERTDDDSDTEAESTPAEQSETPQAAPETNGKARSSASTGKGTAKTAGKSGGTTSRTSTKRANSRSRSSAA